MSGTYPSTPRFSSVDLESNFQVFVSITQSGKRNVRQTGAHRWILRGTYSSLTRQQFMPVYAFLMDQEGQYGSFNFVAPDLATPQGSGNGTPLVDLASQVGKSINTKGWANNETVLKAGDILRFAGHSKVYMMTADATSDGTGLATLAISPALQESPADNEGITINNVPFNVMQTGNVQKYGARNPLLYTFEVSFVEVL